MTAGSAEGDPEIIIRGNIGGDEAAGIIAGLKAPVAGNKAQKQVIKCGSRQ